MASRAGCRAASMATARVTPKESRISQGSRVSPIHLHANEKHGHGPADTGQQGFDQQAADRQGQQPSAQADKGPFAHEQEKEQPSRRTGGPHDRQLAPTGGGIERHQAVYQKHAHEQGYKTQKGKTELVGPDHRLAAFTARRGRPHDDAGGQQRLQGGRRVCCSVGLQSYVDSVRQAELAGEFLEGGNVAQGDATALHQGQPFGIQQGQDLEIGCLPGVDQFDRLALPPAELLAQFLPDQQGKRLGHHRRPVGRLAFTGDSNGPPAQIAIQDGIEADQQKGGVMVGRSDINRENRRRRMD
jgi:hypothetical protein